MNLKECYRKLGGDYDEVLTRLYSEDMIRRFLIKFLNDGTYKLLLEKLEAQDYQEAFRAAHTLKGVCDNLDDIKRVVDGVKIPILYCLMEFCPEVCFTLDELKSVGLRAVCWPNGLLMRWCRAATDLVEEFKKTGDCGTFYNKLMPISECNELLGISDWNPPGMF